MKTRKIVFDGIVFCFLLGSLVLSLQASFEESLSYLGFVSFFAGVFFLIGCLLSLYLQKMGVVTLGDVLFKVSGSVSQEHAWWERFSNWQLMAALSLALFIAFKKSNFSFMELFYFDGVAGALRLFRGLINPNWEVLPRAVLNMTETVFMSFLATFLAVPVAFFFSFLSAKNIMKSPWAQGVYFFFRTSLNVVRSIEALIWAIIFSVWVGIGPFAGMLALMVHSVASLVKQFSESIETVDEGAIEAVTSTGANQIQVIWFAIVPQVLLPYISFVVYRWDINVRMATIIGLVGGGGIGTMLMQYQGQAMWREVGCIIFVIAVVVWILDLASAYIREALK